MFVEEVFCKRDRVEEVKVYLSADGVCGGISRPRYVLNDL